MAEQVERIAMMETVNDNYDSPWKEAVEHYFPEFMIFYFPEAYTQIDWTKEHVFLDQELRAVVQDAELGKRFVDKLVRVTLLNGDEKWIYIHIEVQGTRQAEFAERMFVYNYRLYDRYRRPIASMAVLADEHANWRPDYFSYGVLGSETSIRFPIAKLTDYHDKVNDLLAADNSFAVVTAAHILTQRTRNNDQERYQAKQLLVRLLYQRKWDKQRVIDLFGVIDWMMRLPEELEQQLWQEIEILEENETMQYVTSVERIGIAKGRQEGRQEEASKLFLLLLESKFGAVNQQLQEKVNTADPELIETWTKHIFQAKTPEDLLDS